MTTVTDKTIAQAFSDGESWHKLHSYSREFAGLLGVAGVKLADLPTIESPTVEFHWTDYGDIPASFNYNGARYHVWLSQNGKWEHGRSLFKNPLLNADGKCLKTDESGYFDTRKLDSTKVCNMRLLAALFLAIDVPAAKAEAILKRKAVDWERFLEYPVKD